MAYPGGKAGSGVFQTLINLMPPHEVYIEPFLGGGAVMRIKRPAPLNIGVDLDKAVLPAVTADLTRPARAIAPRAKRRDSPAPIARNGEGIHKGDASSRFEYYRGDGISFLESYQWTGKELVYCDPPYLLSTRTRPLYRFEMDDHEHRRLLRVIRKIPAMVMISGYSSVLYAQELKDWNVANFAATTRGGTMRAEFLWYNFNRPVELHDYRYLGTNYREREAIQRQKRRWVKRLENMPILRRQALLSAIAETAASGDGGSARQMWR